MGVPRRGGKIELDGIPVDSLAAARISIFIVERFDRAPGVGGEKRRHFEETLALGINILLESGMRAFPSERRDRDSKDSAPTAGGTMIQIAELIFPSDDSADPDLMKVREMGSLRKQYERGTRSVLTAMLQDTTGKVLRFEEKYRNDPDFGIFVTAEVWSRKAR